MNRSQRPVDGGAGPSIGWPGAIYSLSNYLDSGAHVLARFRGRADRPHGGDESRR